MLRMLNGYFHRFFCAILAATLLFLFTSQSLLPNPG